MTLKRVQIVNNARGTRKDVAMGKTLSEALSAEIEIIARREATKNNFNIGSESNGLMRAMLHVMQRPELLREAGRLAKEKLEKLGVIPAENPSIVKRPGKDTH